MKSSLIDPELCMLHKGGRLRVAMAKHVDDVKIVGEPDEAKKILKGLQQIFGELKIEWCTFTNCGVKHVQDLRTKEITLDQITYASNLRPIAHPQLSGGRP